MAKRKKGGYRNSIVNLDMKDKVRERKAKEGYSDVSYEETWNMNVELARIIAEKLRGFLKVLKQTPYGGYPGELSSGQEWFNTLRKMIYAFDVYDKKAPYPDFDYREEFKNAADRERYEEEHEVYLEEMRQWEEAETERKARIKEGLQLFAEWFDHLWW